MIEIEELWQLIDENVRALPTEKCPISEAAGRILSHPAFAAQDLPPFDHSSMDGFAFAEAEPGECLVIFQVAAGSVPPRPLRPGEAARIFTGAPLPAGTFGVVRQEDCQWTEDSVQLKYAISVQEGENIRRQGTIRRASGMLLPAGSKLHAGALAFLISGGVRSVGVCGTPSVLHLATGAELCDFDKVDAIPSPGQIADSNGPMMEALLEQEGLRAQRQRLDDNPEALFAAVSRFDGDLLLISGGSGPGDYDHSARALVSAGFALHASRLNSRPGKPLLFATKGARVAFGLPGNPLSHWVCYHAFVRRALAKLTGAALPQLVRVICRGPLPLFPDGRRTWTPARRSIVDGKLLACPLDWEHSGDLSPLAGADLILLDAADPDTHLISAICL